MTKPKVENLHTHMERRLGAIIRDRRFVVGRHDLTVAGRLASRDSDALLADLLAAVSDPTPTGQEVLYAAANLCRCPADSIAGSYSYGGAGRCGCGLSWDVPDPGYPFRVRSWLPSGAERRAEVAAMLTASPAPPETGP